MRGRYRGRARSEQWHCLLLTPGGPRVESPPMSAQPRVRYDVADGVATIALDQPDTRNALSDELLGDLIAAFEAARDDDAVRCVVLASTHERTFSSGGNLAGFAADVPLVHKHCGTERFPRLFPLHRRARQAVDLRRQRPLPRRRARARAGLRPDRRQRGRDASARPRSTSASSRS